MTKLKDTESPIVKYDIPQSLVASLDIEELERRLELSELDMGEAEAEAAAQGWEVSGSGSTSTGPSGTTTTGTVTAKKSW